MIILIKEFKELYLTILSSTYDLLVSGHSKPIWLFISSKILNYAILSDNLIYLTDKVFNDYF